MSPLATSLHGITEARCRIGRLQTRCSRLPRRVAHEVFEPVLQRWQERGYGRCLPLLFSDRRKR